MTETLFPLNISSSLLKDLDTCETYFFRRHCQKYVFTGEINSHLYAGGLFARACEIVRVEFFNNKLSSKEAVKAGTDFILNSKETGNPSKSLRILADSLKRYFTKFPLDSELIPARLADGTHAIEYEFVFDMGIPHPDIPGRNICIKGKLDQLGEFIVGGKVLARYVIDEKTTSSIARLTGTKIVDIEREKNKYRLDKQILIYAWAARELGVPVEKVKIRVIPLSASEEDAFELDISVNNFMIDTFIRSVYARVHELVAKYQAFKEEQGRIQEYFYPTYGHNCTDWNSLCEMWQGCASKDGEDLLALECEQRVWESDAHEKLIPLIEFKKNLGIL